MSRLREMFARVAALFRFRVHDADMDEEFAAHLAMATEDYIAQGLEPKAARRAALIDFGGVQQAREQHRESRGLPALESWARDIQLAMRSLRRDPSLSFFAIAIVALGIGAATLVFSVTNTLLLQPLPFEDPDRLVWIANGSSPNLSAQTIQVGNLLDLRERSQTFEDMAGFYAFYGPGDLHIDGEMGPQRITGVPLTGNFLDLLGVEPVLGRGFTEDEVRDRARVILVGNRLWRSRYDRDPSVVGRSLRLDGEPATIIGVLPPEFDFERILTPGRSADVFVPFPLDEENDRRGNTLAVIGRLKPGLDLALAQRELTQLAEEIQAQQIERRNDISPGLAPLHGRVSGATRPSLFVLSGAVGLLMLLVCANLSNLLLARASTRRKEMAIHVAMGASRGRLLRRLLLESLALSLLGAGLGLALAVVGAQALAQLDGTEIPLLHEVRIDGWVVGFCVGLATLVGLGFGVVPALQASATSPARAMRATERNTGDGRGASIRQVLVVGEVALACVLLVGVGLFSRSLVSALGAERGFQSDNVVALRVDPPRGSLEPQQQLALYDELLRSVRGAPGVTHAGLTDALPLGDNFGWRVWDTRPEGASEEDQALLPLIRVVDSGFREALGVRLIAGRFFEAGDARPPEAYGPDGVDVDFDRVVVVNDAFARQLFPQIASPGEAVGRRLVTGEREYRIVGVVAEARYFDLERPSGPEMYLSVRQMPWSNSMDLVVRTAGDPAPHLSGIRAALREAAPRLPVEGLRTMDSLVERATFDRRAVTGLLGGFAGFGWLLAALGVYSVIAYSVAQRRRELGVRMAFGATGRRVGWSVVLQTLRPVLLGVVVGVASATSLGRLIGSQLYGVETGDPVAVGTAVLVLLFSAVLAAYLPARRAARLDVADVLRSEG